MASLFSNIRQGFGGRSNKTNNQPNKGSGNPSPTSFQPPLAASLNPQIPPMAHSPALSEGMSLGQPAGEAARPPSSSRKPAFFFREEYSGLIVRGNFMTLAAKPVLVEEGEWLAHQVVEQARLLDLMVQIIRVVDDSTGLPICNPEVCPTMSAGDHTYTWLDNNKKPIKIPASTYINLVQKWIVGKISDQTLFPTDMTNAAAIGYASGSITTPGATNPIPAGATSMNAHFSQLSGRSDWLGKSSGFPENFESDIKSMYRQMMRCYAHIYHGHWIDPFWNINAYKELNTCFIHFINVGKLFGLLADKDMEPMQPLIDLWIEKGLLPSPQQQKQAKPHSLPQDSQAPAASGTPAAGAAA